MLLVVAATERDIANTEVTAPFDGLLETDTAELGSLMTAGTWLFLVGSIFFAMKPTIRLWREFKLLRMGDYADIAAKKP